MITTEFQIRSYGWQELAVLYGAGITPESATKRLSSWVADNASLYRELELHGWKKGKKTLTPIQVSTIIRFLGTP